ncbi:MAG: LPP20 family lipoprotein [Deltaproteobacteria bacterium]|nr:MAG: LPP20 family lipoprotein [Deltaproteobacteria bacterium]
MRGRTWFTLATLLSAFFLVPFSSWAQTDVIQQFDKGSINWSTGKVTAIGIGAPPSNAANAAQARTMARRAALLDARRNLLEITQGVQVDSMTLVRNAVVESDIIRSSVQGFIQNSQPIDTAYMSDGSVEVTVVMSMTGEFAEVVLPQRLAGGQGSTPAPVVPPTPGAPTPGSQIFTGLVVDARGLGTRPAMSPKILDETGKEVYGSAMVDREFAVKQGMAGYAKDIKAAQTNARVTNNPLTIQGIRATGGGKSDIVISNSDASSLLSAAENLSFLQKCRVMVVLD